MSKAPAAKSAKGAKVAQVMAKRTQASPEKPAPVVTLPKIPGDTIVKKRGRPAGGKSTHPEAVRAREARARRRMTPANMDAPASDAPALTGEVHTPPPPAPLVLAPDVRAKLIRSWAGLLKVCGIVAATIFGEHWKVTEEDARNAAELIVDAWPDADLMDMSKVLASGALLGMVSDRVKKTRQLRAEASSGTLAPVVHEKPTPAQPTPAVSEPPATFAPDGAQRPQGWSG